MPLANATMPMRTPKIPMFTYKASNLFSIDLPDPISGGCPARSRPVYRLWNARADMNHRHTTNETVRDQMLANGDVAEGDGAGTVSMCSPRQNEPSDPRGRAVRVRRWRGPALPLTRT